MTFDPDGINKWSIGAPKESEDEALAGDHSRDVEKQRRISADPNRPRGRMAAPEPHWRLSSRPTRALLVFGARSPMGRRIHRNLSAPSSKKDGMKILLLLLTFTAWILMGYLLSKSSVDPEAGDTSTGAEPSNVVLEIP